ncbi:hypothetical protein CBL_05334 [Carabus blaptoides fortunei]
MNNFLTNPLYSSTLFPQTVTLAVPPRHTQPAISLHRTSPLQLGVEPVTETRNYRTLGIRLEGPTMIGPGNRKYIDVFCSRSIQMTGVQVRQTVRTVVGNGRGDHAEAEEEERCLAQEAPVLKELANGDKNPEEK